jgi:hypothetical protein
VHGAVEEKETMSGKWKEKAESVADKNRWDDGRIAKELRTEKEEEFEDEGPWRGMNEMKNRRR